MTEVKNLWKNLKRLSRMDGQREGKGRCGWFVIGRMDRWMDGWMDGWVHGRIENQLDWWKRAEGDWNQPGYRWRAIDRLERSLRCHNGRRCPAQMLSSLNRFSLQWVAMGRNWTQQQLICIREVEIEFDWMGPRLATISIVNVEAQSNFKRGE